MIPLLISWIILKKRHLPNGGKWIHLKWLIIVTILLKSQWEIKKLFFGQDYLVEFLTFPFTHGRTHTEAANVVTHVRIQNDWFCEGVALGII